MVKRIIKRNKEFYSSVFKMQLRGVKLSKAARRGIRDELYSIRKHYRLIHDSV